MWRVVHRRFVHRLGAATVLLWAVLSLACGEAANELRAVPAVARSAESGGASDAAGGAEGRSAPRADSIRRGGQGPESILEFGLFGPVVPTLDSDGYYQSDCRFENDPYETCL